MIIEQLLVTSMSVFCYLIGDEKSREAVLIDPAGDYDKIFEKTNSYGLTIKWIINTHGHFDHTSGNAYIIKKTNAELLIHKGDKNKLKGKINKILSLIVGGQASPEPMKYLNDGDEIAIGDIKLRVIYTPGHTKGSICLYINGHLFTGDTLFTEGMGRIRLLGNFYDQIIDSIKNKLLVLPDETIIWPGHNYGEHRTSTIGEQKKLYLKESHQ